MLYKENIPTGLQVMYNCDFLEWDPKSCCYQCVASDESIGYWITGTVCYDEIQSALADLEEHWNNLIESYMEDYPVDITKHEYLL